MLDIEHLAENFEGYSHKWLRGRNVNYGILSTFQDNLVQQLTLTFKSDGVGKGYAHDTLRDISMIMSPKRQESATIHVWKKRKRRE